MNLWVSWSGQLMRFAGRAESVMQPSGFGKERPMILIGFNHEKRGIRERGFADDAAWGQTRCLGMTTKRQQAAALQTLRACQYPLHPPQRVRYHRDQRRDRIRPHGDRHVVGSERRRLSLGAGVNGWRTTVRTGKFSVFRVNAELERRWVALHLGRCRARGCQSPAFRRNSFMKLSMSTVE